MVSSKQVEDSLDKLLVPVVKRSIVGMNILRETDVTDGKVKIDLSSAALDEKTQEWIKTKTYQTIKGLPGVDEVEIDFTESSPSELNEIKDTIAIMIGKGGVGKSLVASLTAVGLKRQGVRRRYSRCRHNRVQYSQNVRDQRFTDRKR
jgi:ATP-binding protein involved in chromosome partitioning